MIINDDTHPPSESALRVGLEECVQLLQGPSDERRYTALSAFSALKGTYASEHAPHADKAPATMAASTAYFVPFVTVVCCNRFVGLLLATKLLPAGDEHVMLAIYNAVGSSFITRLLLPLKSAKVTPSAAFSL